VIVCVFLFSGIRKRIRILRHKCLRKDSDLRHWEKNHMCNAVLYRVLIALLWAFAYHNACIGIDCDGSLRNFKDCMSPTMICGGNMICVVAVVVSLSKAITKLITFSTEVERIFALCVCVCARACVRVCVCVDVSWITDKAITNQNVVVLIYIAELNKKLCIITPKNFKTLNF